MLSFPKKKERRKIFRLKQFSRTARYSAAKGRENYKGETRVEKEEVLRLTIGGGENQKRVKSIGVMIRGKAGKYFLG